MGWMTAVRRFPLNEFITGALFAYLAYSAGDACLQLAAAEWIQPRIHEIDGTSYLQGAARMLEVGDWIYTSDSYHSVGMQILTAALFRVWGSVSPIPVYWWNGVVWMAMLALASYLGNFLTGRRCFLWLTPLVLSQSAILLWYRGLVQYEITVAALCLAVVAIQLREPTWRTQFGSGVLIAILAIFRVHFILGMAVLWFLPQRTRGNFVPRYRKELFKGFILIALPFNLFYGLLLQRPFLFQSNVSVMVLSGDNSPISSGQLYPYSKRVEPFGWRYVVKHPADYLKLLKKRAGYFVGLTPDLWFVETSPSRLLSNLFRIKVETARVAAFIGSLCLLLLGVWNLTHSEHLAKVAVPLVLLLPLVIVGAPNLFINSSARMLVPALPALILLQVMGLNLFAKQNQVR